MPRGRTVFRYRASWTLTTLKKTGAIRNPSVARWELTESGRSRLDREEKTWSIEPFRGSKAKVRGGSTVPTVTAAGPASVGPAWPTPAWRLFAADFPDLATTVEGRVRPDLAPTPQRAIARNVVFYGPPGTGKTYIAKKVAVALTGEDEPGPESSWRLVQFHPSYAYEDFVQGLRPALEATDLQYKLHQGPFLQVCKAAEDDPDRFHVLIIDEINRGDPARIFGELLYALEYRDESIELAGGGSLVVPSNLVIVGTMNSVDRSVALVDHALRRRFAFVRVDPNPEAITTSPRLGAMLASFNAWLVAQLDPEHAVGHSVFLNPALAELSSDETIARVWRHDVRPLLEEYFFGQPEQLRAAALAWRKAQEETEDEDEAEDAGNTPS
jgi:5-methylcytosine-specific restriction protein B